MIIRDLHSKLLCLALSESECQEFLTQEQEDYTAAWALFEMLSPERAEEIKSYVEPIVAEVIKDLEFKRKYDHLNSQGEEYTAARLSILHKASKLNWA